MAVSGAVTSLDYNTSALRSGLLTVKPIEIAKTIKKYGLRFRQVTRRLDFEKSPRTFEDVVKLNNEIFVSKIEVPPQFDPMKLAEYYTKKSIDNYKKDTELKQIIQEVKESTRVAGPLLSFVRFIRNRFESELRDYIRLNARGFLQSNFPLTFFSSFVLSDYTFHSCVLILENLVRRYEIRSNLPRARTEFRIYQRVIGEMKGEISPIIDQMDTFLMSELCLKRVIDLWNSETYDDIYKPKFLDMKKVKHEGLSRLENEFKTNLRETRHFLYSINPSVVSTKYDFRNDSTSQMIGKLLMNPTVLRSESWQGGLMDVSS